MKEKKVSQSRIVAAIIDEIIVSVISTIFGIVLGIVMAFSNSDKPLDEFVSVNTSSITLLSSIFSVVFILVWFTIIPLLNKNRATVGKLIVGLKVIRDDDTKPGIVQLLIRNIRLYIAIPSLIIAIITTFDIPEGLELSLTAITFIISFAEFILYIFIIVFINQDKKLFYDAWAKTTVVDKLYDPNYENYQTIEEIKDWADVKGFEDKTSNEVEYKDPEEVDPTDKGYWD